MQGYIQLVIQLYKKELQQDFELFEGLIHEWIQVPRDTSIHTYMAMYGVFGCIVRVLVVLLIRVPVWWPLHAVAYVINCTVRYTFVPLFAFLHLQLNKAEVSGNTLTIHLYSYLLTCVEWMEWLLKTVFLITYFVHKIVTWVHNRRTIREYINYKIDQIVVKAHTLRGEKHKQGWLVKVYSVVKRGWVTYITPLPPLVWKGLKLTFSYVNPLNYTWVKYIVYRKNRQNMILIFKCRIIIRYGLLKGIVKYGYKGWLWVKISRWGRIIIHLFKVILIQYHPTLAISKVKYWCAFHGWWLTTLLYRYAGYYCIYITGGLRWLIMCAAIICTPICYLLVHALYVLHAVKIWFTRGIWISRNNFYLMVGWNPSALPWKFFTRTR